MMNQIKWDEKGLVTAIVQEQATFKVLMVAHMNEEALMTTLATGRVHFFSRSRNKLWMKGETSGNVQYVKDIKIDCDGDSLLIFVDAKGPACHTGEKTCFFRSLNSSEGTEETDPNDASILKELYSVILDRKLNPKDDSYTSSLFKRGLDVILKKVGEESAEVLIASKNEKRSEIVYETADLMYHLMVMLVDREVELKEIYGELKKRR